jgi:hypothetical protein
MLTETSIELIAQTRCMRPPVEAEFQGLRRAATQACQFQQRPRRKPHN